MAAGVPAFLAGAPAAAPCRLADRMRDEPGRRILNVMATSAAEE